MECIHLSLFLFPLLGLFTEPLLMCHQTSHRPNRRLPRRRTQILNNLIYMLDFLQDWHPLMPPLLKSPPSDTGQSPTRSRSTLPLQNVYVFISNALIPLERFLQQRRCISKFRMDVNSKVQSGRKGDRDRKPGGGGTFDLGACLLCCFPSRLPGKFQ